MTGNGDFGRLPVATTAIRLLRSRPTPAPRPIPNINGYGMNVADYFTPFNEWLWPMPMRISAPAAASCCPISRGRYPHEYIGSGKSGVIYVIDRDNMGGYNASTDTGRVIQEVNLGNGNFDTAAYFNETIYYHGVNGVLKAYTLTNGMLSAAPSAQASVPNSSGQGATPSISANGTANGIVWNVQFSGSHEVLHAYDATTLQELYNSSQNAARDQLGAGVKFITPTIADGAGVCRRLRLCRCVRAARRRRPRRRPRRRIWRLPLSSASQVQLTWVNNAEQSGRIQDRAIQ